MTKSSEGMNCHVMLIANLIHGSMGRSGILTWCLKGEVAQKLITGKGKSYKLDDCTHRDTQFLILTNNHSIIKVTHWLRMYPCNPAQGYTGLHCSDIHHLHSAPEHRYSPYARPYSQTPSLVEGKQLGMTPKQLKQSMRNSRPRLVIQK